MVNLIRECIKMVRSIVAEMRSDCDRARATNSELRCVVFWVWAWCAWIGIAVFWLYIVPAVLFGWGVFGEG